MGGRRSLDGWASPTVRVAVCAGGGLVAAAIAAVLGPWWLAPLIAWDVASLSLLVWTWRRLWPLGSAATASHATRESPGRANTDLLLIAGSMISLAAVSIVLSWSVVHSVYTLRYAKLYYGGKDGGVDFHGNQAPAYADFAYLALTVGMTFQVSDTDLATTAFRRLALRHAVLSYFFGTLIIA